MGKVKIGITSFTDPRAVKGIQEINKQNLVYQEELERFLKKSGFDCVVPIKDRCVNGRPAAEEVIRKFTAADVDCMVFGCWKWTDPMLAVDVARRLDRPVALVGSDDEASTPLGCIAAVGAALWEIAPNSNALNHFRTIGDYGLLASWARGAGSISWLKKQSLLLWGGSYCLKMSHLEDDPSMLKSFLVGDILIEDQYALIAGAEKILAKKPARIGRFVKWLGKNGSQIEYDGKRSRPEVLERQIALYLSARDRLAELSDEGISGVSIKCQPALSEQYGVTGCVLPALLPYGEDAEGPRATMPTSCEGDIKGLITSMLLQEMAGGVPAGFGDIRHIRIDGKVLLIISNCGAASVYYAAPGKKTPEVMSKVYFKPQCQGAAGCAVGYMSPCFGTATLARLIRREGEYVMQYAVGGSVGVDRALVDRLGWGDVWPVSLFDIGLDLQRFTEIMGSNHYSFVPGDYSRELEFSCRAAGIPMENISGPREC
jgi:L-fucose/D-arabinose isomerase